MKRQLLSPSQPSIIPTLHRSMQLKMQSLLMRLSLRRYFARSLLVGMRTMTQCLVQFVKLHQNLFFRITFCQIKHRKFLSDGSSIRYFFSHFTPLERRFQGKFAVLCKIMQKGLSSFPIMPNLFQVELLFFLSGVWLYSLAFQKSCVSVSRKTNAT